ncbi:MAG: methionine ABC transporter permease [Bacilli bacterium]|nr:ABC transporter permease [Bacillales bacterium]MDY2575148.1 methionine ABC transporter permease [Bacilli bacterium]
MGFNQMMELLFNGLGQTLYMTLVSTFFAYLFGIPLGVILNITSKEGISPCKWLNTLLGVMVNILRSIPFLILLVFVMPLTKIIVGTRIGTSASIVPLVIGAIPFIGRMVESSLNEVDKGVIEASLAMGASKMKIIFKVLLSEAKPSLLIGFSISITTILGYSAMAGFVGGGGLGDIAYQYGYVRNETELMWLTIILLVIIVQIFQELGMLLAKKLDRRINK